MTKFGMYTKLNTVNFTDNAFTVDYLGFEYTNFGFALNYVEETKATKIGLCKQFLTRFIE